MVLDFPLESIHKMAFKAAEATHCAMDQGKFWEMHDRLFANQQALEPSKAHAEAIGLDVAKFEQCMSSGKHVPDIRREMAEGQKAGVTGTPSSVLAVTDPSNPKKVKGLSFIRGAQPFDGFKAEIERALASLAPAPAATPPAK